MYYSYLQLVFRNLIRNKVSFIINFLGMSVALGCCIVAFVNYQYGEEFDGQHTKADKIYRIGFTREFDGKESKYAVAPVPVEGFIKENFKEVTKAAKYLGQRAQFRIGDELFQSVVAYADSEWSEIFSIELLEGSSTLTSKSAIVISDRLAVTYFGSTHAVGKELTQIINGVPRDFVVGGVFKAFPFNSSFRFDLLTSFENFANTSVEQTVIEGDWKTWATTFLLIEDNAVVGRIEKQLQQFIKPQSDARPDIPAKTFYIEPFIGMGQRAFKEKTNFHGLNYPKPPAAVIAPFFMALFLLLVACFNFTNNSIAMAGKRLKEIGIRKVLGGKRKELVLQFFMESFAFCFFALTGALFLAEVFASGWNSIWTDLEISIHYLDNIPLMAAIVVLVLLTTLLSGGYPALFISSFNPVSVLKGTVKFGGNNLFTKSLLVLQFSLSLAAVIFAIAFYNNSKYQLEYDLGYDYRAVVQVPIESESQYIQLRNELLTNPLISTVGGSEHHIFSSSYKTAIKYEQKEKEVDALNIGDDYFKTLSIKVIAGREFQKDAANDVNESVIVNEEFTRVFGLGQDAVGKRILIGDSLQYFIVGVTKDVYLQALMQPLTPVMFRYRPEADYKFLVAATTPQNLLEVNKQVKANWAKLFPNTLYRGRLMEEFMTIPLEHFTGVIKLYTFMGAVSILMSVSGLFSLVSLHLQKRTKELGIRKVMGAPLANILLHSSKLFLIILFVSCVLGSLAGSMMVNGMMSSIWEYYEAINFSVLASAILLMIGICLVTVSIKIVKNSLAKPVDALRYE